MQKKVKAQGKSIKMILAGLLCILSVIIMLFSIFTPKTETGEFIPPEFDGSAILGLPNIPENVDWQEIDAKIFKFCINGRVTVNEEMADIWLYNPTENSVWLKTRVVDVDGNILGETGLIKQNEYIRSVKLNVELPVGTAIKLKIMAYQPETYYSEGAVDVKTSIFENNQ